MRPKGVAWISDVIAVALVATVVGGLPVGTTEARPNFQLPWPQGTSWGINGGYVYGCGTHSGSDYYAIDFTVPYDNAIAASAGGRVLAIVPYNQGGGGYGSYVEIEHGGGFVTRYAHLSSFATIAVGDWVRQGQTIGWSGDTGSPGQYHLHFRGTKNGAAYRMEPMSGASDFGQWGYSVEAWGCSQNRANTTGWASTPSRADVATFYGPTANRGIIHEFLSNGASSLPYQDPPWYDSGEGNYTLSMVGNRMVMGDFTGDGRRDIATFYGSGSNATIHVWKSTGTGLQFLPAMTWSGTDFNLSAVGDRMVAGDFNADGFDDIAVFYSNGATATIHVWTSTGSTLTYGNWYSASYDLTKVAGRMVAGDFNRDWKTDIATLYETGTNSARIGTGFSTRQQWFSSTSYTPSMVGNRFVAGDFNGDGRIDVSALYQSGSAASLHVWTSSGSAFSWAQWNSAAGYDLNRVAGRMVAGDFATDSTRQGYDDVATFWGGTSDYSTIDVWRSTGTSFSPYQIWFSSGSYTLAVVADRVVAGDLDDR